MPRPSLAGSTRLDRAIAYLAPSWAAKRQSARLRFEAAAQFRGADTTRLLSDWLTHSLDVVNPDKMELRTLQERTQELNRNNPISSSITDTLMVNVVGQGLQPQSGMRAKELGLPEEEAQRLRRQAEAIFDRMQKREKFRIKQALAFRKIVEDGEVIANLPLRSDPWRYLRRGVELIESGRLGGMGFYREGVFQGIELDQDTKEPQRYWIRKPNLTNNDFELPRYEWTGIPARDSRGRPLILHNFLQKRPGQLRGIPFLAPALMHFKYLGDYFSAAVVAAKMAAFVSLIITTSDPTGMMPGPLARPTGTPGASLTGGRAPKTFWEPGSILRLGLGETANMLDPKGVHEAFGSFMEIGLRILGATGGMPYELLLKDFSKTNYSSARAALLEARRWFMFLRAWFGWEFCQPIWELELEDAYLRGEFHVPYFYENREEYCRARWMGGGWGWVDPVKEVGASIAAILARLSTHADELGGQGKDWEDVFEQLVQEQKYAEALGLPPLVVPKSSGVQGEGRENEEPGERADPARAHLTAILGYLAQIAATSREFPAEAV